MKLNMINEAGSLGSITHDRAVVGTPLYTSPEAVRLGMKGTPRPPSKLGRKPLPRFKYLDRDEWTEWTGDPETMVHGVLQHFDTKMTWMQIWHKIKPELVRMQSKDSRFEVPSYNQTKSALKQLIQRKVIRSTAIGDKLAFELI